MALKTASRLGVVASVQAARLPFDVGFRLVGASDSQLALAVDRADAHARALAGFVLRDSDLQDDATRRHAATDERIRALRLREQAEAVDERADERITRTEETAAARREAAASAAQQRKAQAEERRRVRGSSAEESARQRRRGVERTKAAKEETVQARANEARLDALEEKAEALEEEEEALIARDEAKRLARAAADAKEQRKRSSNGGG